ncbi:TIGR04211 family SH3 domain-containing protein [Psychromonas sp. 14N.309.X.WAT.B.A12]|uniref:TIGR04211 family SH3 domain-containing protein n=1 Tax=unclassified Psychromonas TaxID=2614957 RepID=UPI0025B1EA4C|nr:TIGR04211 family SH3 domain-containing protein [Psychromonas sp. 14N.309.X.WAT.B.A12]MDN2664049.1 TIGR04211 family SH3 domain-containing protein [Psychromonas sp. 14N.309.X.WAT.B.A12]
MKLIKLFLLCLLFPISSFAATQYVSDELSIYMHSGPSLQYRIIGTIEVGTAVDTLQYNEKTKFSQVRTSTGRVGWVKASEIQTQQPAKSLLPALQKKYQESQDKLNTINSENEAANAEQTQAIIDKDSLIAQLDSEKRALRDTIADLKERNMELDLLQDTKDERVKMEWLMYGGSVLFFGMLVGLIIPFLPRRKKRTDNW